MRTIALLTIGALTGASLAAMLIRRRVEVIERVVTVEKRAPIDAQTLKDVAEFKARVRMNAILERQRQVDLEMGVSPFELWEEEQAALAESEGWAERMIEHAKEMGIL